MSSAFAVFLQGLVIGMAYLMPIGAQNLYVIQFSLKKGFPICLKIALVVIIMDLSMVAACYHGLGLILERYPFLRALMSVCGGLFVIFLAIGMLKKKISWRDEGDGDGESKNFSEKWWDLLKTSFVITWLNPQAIVDGSLLYGGIRATLSTDQEKLFLAGTLLSSLCWFSFLSISSALMRKIIPLSFWNLINRICSFLLIALGAYLIYQGIRGSGVNL